MLTLTEAAASLGLAPSTLRHQIRNRKLRARKLGREWYLFADEVERYRVESRKARADDNRA
jgi:excisionase family DNA binding protein